MAKTTPKKADTVAAKEVKESKTVEPKAEEDEDDEEEKPTRRIDFKNLKFGKDYEI